MYYCDCLWLHLQLCYWLLCFICTCICICVSLCISIFSAAPHLIIAMSGRFTQQLLVVWLDLFGGDTDHAVQKASDDHQSSSGYLRVDWTCQQEQNTSILSHPQTFQTSHRLKIFKDGSLAIFLMITRCSPTTPPLLHYCRLLQLVQRDVYQLQRWSCS